MRQAIIRTRILSTILCLGISATSATLQAQSQNSLDFGSNRYISLPTSTPVPIGNGHYTLEAWIKPTAMGTYGIIGWGPWGSGGCVNALRLHGGGLVNYWWGNDLTLSTADLSGAWHHVAVTFDGTSRIMYLDGVNIGSDLPGNNHTVPSAANLAIGRTNNSEYFSGQIDEVRIWNRGLCQAEIQNNMNGTLPNPTTQTGLVAYYQLNQGTASGTNTGLTTATDASVNGNNGTLNNFALTGSTSNWVAGASAITGNVSPYSTTTPSSATETLTKTISGITAFAGCGVVTSVTPSGASPVSGTVVTKVSRDGSVGSYGGLPFVQRHYDIEPTTSPNTSTANITLYYTQAEFTAYNAAKGTYPALPVDATDAANNKANLRISQLHGVPTGGNAPSNYPATWGGTGSAHVLITPTTVTWNGTDSRWEVTFPVTGFSGFFATTAASPLPIGLTAFSATKTNDNDVVLNWSVAHPKDGKDYIIERSTDASNFTTIGTIKATIATEYSLHDLQPLNGKSYYRLRALEVDGTESYSHIESVFIASAGNINVYPSPAKDFIIVETNSSLPTPATLSDMHGRVLMQLAVSSGKKINIAFLPPGLYILRLSGQTFKVIKE